MGMTIPDRLCSALLARAWSQRQLASRLGWSGAYVSQVLTGAQPISRHQVARIATALGTTPDALPDAPASYPCVHCGTPFTPQRATRRYCSERCCQAAYRARRRSTAAAAPGPEGTQ